MHLGQALAPVKPAFAMLRLGAPEGKSNAGGGPPSRIAPLLADKGGSRHGRIGGAMMRRADYSFARMSGMLDLSREENAKHFLPRWL